MVNQGWLKLRRMFCGIALLMAVIPRIASADPHDPGAFTLLGSSPFNASGTYQINTTASPPTLTPPVGAPILGYVSGAGAAVFVFDDVTIGSGVTVRGWASGRSRCSHRARSS